MTYMYIRIEHFEVLHVSGILIRYVHFYTESSDIPQYINEKSYYTLLHTDVCKAINRHTNLRTSYYYSSSMLVFAFIKKINLYRSSIYLLIFFL